MASVGLATIGAGGTSPRCAAAAPDGPLSFLSDVAAVIDGRSLRLADGRDLMLPHILPPGPDRHQPMRDTAPIRHAARMMGDFVLGKTVRIDLLDPAQDRYGRLRADVSVAGVDVAAWMAAQGMVRIFPEPDAEPTRILNLIASETTARAENTGFWGDGGFILRNAAQPDFSGDQFEIVQGMVRRITRIGTRDHLEFGDDWRTDFTAGLSSPIRRRVKRDGGSLRDMIGETIILRGWIRNWNGPFMEVDQACQITRPS